MQSQNSSSEPHRGPASRRGKQLAPIQTNLQPKQTPTRLQRPRPVETIVYERPTVPLTSDSPQLKRRTSRGGLLALFSRAKSTKATKANGNLEIRKEEEELYGNYPANNLTGASKNGISSITQDELVKMMSPKLKMDAQSSSANATPKSKSLKKDRQLSPPKTWDPPPLFQVYPQSVKYATLAAPILSAEAILRMDRSKQVSNTKQVGVCNESGIERKESSNETNQQKLGDTSHLKAPPTDVISNLEWTTKVFVLATSGFLLQYAGEGSFDRLPEKVMQLGKDSAAFASDAIHGKYYVLQVSQAPNEDGSVTKTPSKSVLSRIGLRHDLRRSASCFLLVLDSPEEMSIWMAIVRKEIEALGGKPHRPDMGVRKTTDEVVRTLREKPSRRYLIQRDPHETSRFEQDVRSSSSDLNLDDSARGFGYGSNVAADTSSLTSTRRQSLATRISTDAPSTTHSVISADQAQLDRLRSSPRFSHASIGTKTVSTSCGPSPIPSPSRSRFPIDDAYTDRPRRKSIQTLPSPVTAHRQSFEQGVVPKSPQRQSTNNLNVRSSSPAAPNFSKRISYSNSPPGDVAVPVIPTLPTSINAHSRKSFSPARSRQISGSSDRPESIIGELPSALNKRPRVSNGVDSSSSIVTVKDLHNHNMQMPFDVTPAGRLVPRRYSSHEQSNARPPNSFFRHTPSPHPPPQGALPSIPRANTISLKSQAETQIINSGDSQAKLPALRRPTSMQIRSDPLPLSSKRSFSGATTGSGARHELSGSSAPLNSSGQYSNPSQYPRNGHHQTTVASKNVSDIAPLYSSPHITLPHIPSVSSRWPDYSMAGKNYVQGVSVS